MCLMDSIYPRKIAMFEKYRCSHSFKNEPDKKF